MVDDTFNLSEEIRKEIDKEIIRSLIKTIELENTTVDEDGNVTSPTLHHPDLDWLT